MKFNSWLKKEGFSQSKFQIVANSKGYNLSRSAVAKWSSGDRIPRKEEMRIIKHLTQGEVTANDFYDWENL